MATRLRTNIQGGWSKGYVIKDNGNVYNSSDSGSSGYDKCEDIYGLGVGNYNYLKIDHASVECSPCYIHDVNGSPWRVCAGFMPATPAVNGYFYGHNLLAGSPTDTYIATETMAKTNPSNPVVDVPVFVYELGDVVKLIRDLGRERIRKGIDRSTVIPDSSIPEAVGSSYLLYKFGIAPLVSDLTALLSFSSAIDRRVKDFKRMEKNGLSKSHRKSTPYLTTATKNDKVSVNSIGPFFSCPRERVTEEKAWGISKWTPIPGHPFPKSAEEMRSTARKAILGLTLDLATVWETIPFSWLIDYFLNIGSYLQTYRNIVPLQCTELCVCRTTSTKDTLSSATSGNLTCPGMVATLVTKSRKPVGFVAPSAHLGFLGNSQMSIIAALGTQKLR